jgi:hypothetical protein
VRRARVLVLSAAAAAGLCLLAVSGHFGLQVRSAGGTRRVCARACSHTRFPARACGQGVRARTCVFRVAILRICRAAWTCAQQQRVMPGIRMSEILFINLYSSLLI